MDGLYDSLKSLSEYGQESAQGWRGTNKKAKALRNHFKDIMKYTFQLKSICGWMTVFPKTVHTPNL